MTLDVSALPSSQERYTLEKKLLAGAFGPIFRASDKRAPDVHVAVEIYNYAEVTPGGERRRVQEEYLVLRDVANHPNVVHFLGAFSDAGGLKIWLVTELCACSARDLASARLATGKRLSEEHIAFILKGVIKALHYLGESGVLHRDVRAANVLLTCDGDVKLGGFMLSCRAPAHPPGEGETEAPRVFDGAVVGSPAWMAPEVAGGSNSGYDSRADVWSLGITAIEVADGRAPYEDMHTSGALFQVARNPPPTLERPSNWSNTLNDFICECLEKNPEHRPFVAELVEHPLIQVVPENDYYLAQELKKLTSELVSSEVARGAGGAESALHEGGLRRAGAEPEKLHVEDLAALEPLTEDVLLRELQVKWRRGAYTSYVGDMLLALTQPDNSVADQDECHKRYECRSRPDNEPHVFGVADAAYQSALHHGEPQHIVLCGESGSGKSAMAKRALKHLAYLGDGGITRGAVTTDRIHRAVNILHAATSAATPINAHSTRCVLQTQVTYSHTGKLSGAIFWLYQLEKWRVASTDMTQANFNLLYYFYDAIEAQGKLENYGLEKGRKHRYLRSQEPTRGPRGARESSEDNVTSYRRLCEDLATLEWEEEEMSTLESILAAVLVLGNIRFRERAEGAAEIENKEEAEKVARLLQLDRAKFSWALLNYCVVQRGTALQRRHSADEARDARDTLAAALYKRLLDSLVNRLNLKLSFGRAVFGDKYSISIVDMFGFECFHRNRLEQLIVNTTNEQIQFLYNQRTFVWEMLEATEEEVPAAALHFYDNKTAVDQLMGRPLGLFYILDEASRSSGGLEFIMSTIKNSRKGPYVKLSGSHEFSVAHYAGKIDYDAREMADKNRDFLPPEMIETMRASANPSVQILFRNKLTGTGNLTLDPRPARARPVPTPVTFNKADKDAVNAKTRKYNTVSRGQWSQVHRMRTAAATYRATSLELLRQLSIGPGSGGAHFVKCVRCDLAPKPASFQPDLVRHQLRALAILDTARARQQGFSCRVPFAEFIRRYKFLAFDFEETVEESRENCRLLLIRLKMEGWHLGKTKVFLKYYNEEFLARLYENQVKKIVKVQCMMRAFMARRKAAKSKSKKQHLEEIKKQQSLNIDEDEAALLIQKAYRGYVVRKAYGPLVSKATDQIDEETAGFLKRFALKWKSRSLFQVLLQYRAVRYQDLVHFAQQVHIYNQATVSVLSGGSVVAAAVRLERVEPCTLEQDFLGAPLPSVRKLPFRLDGLQYIDTAHMCQTTANTKDTFACQNDSDQETWDEPLKRHGSGRTHAVVEDTLAGHAAEATATIIHVPYCRDPEQPITKLPADEPEDDATVHQGSVNRPSVYKKKQTASHYQPPAPWSAREEQRRAESSQLPPEASDSRRIHHAHVIPDDAHNPIHELQMLARSASGGDDCDDPPYNFQAMLKKTPRNRASMKRSGESEFSSPASPAPSLKSRRSSKKTRAPAPAAPRARARSPDSGAAEKASEVRWSNKVELERVQLAPGLMIEGEVTDL